MRAGGQGIFLTDSLTRYHLAGHIMTGPVYVCGAEPGDVVQVRWHAQHKLLFRPTDLGYGWTGCRWALMMLSILLAIEAPGS